MIGVAFLLGVIATVSPALAQESKVLPISPALCDEMRSRNVMTPISPLSCARLRLVVVQYVGLDGRDHNDGEIVVMDAVAEHVRQIFAKLYAMRFPIAKMRLMNAYNGNDSASTRDNNTSSFNARKSTGGNSLSMHAYGLAIDLNPVQNPYATRRAGFGLVYRPQPGTQYADRMNVRAGMAESAIDVFADNGFTGWGGDWRNPIDYQHFQTSRRLAEQLASLPPAQAQAEFRRYVERYRACRKSHGGALARMQCADAQ